MRTILGLWLLGQIWCGHAHLITPQPTYVRPTQTINDRGEFAVVPTTAGEIGVNPVLSDLGDADTYVGEIYGTDTQYITLIPPATTTAVSKSTNVKS